MLFRSKKIYFDIKGDTNNHPTYYKYTTTKGTDIGIKQC